MTQALKLIPIKTFAERLAVSRSSIYRLLDEDPAFPRPVRVAVRRIAFVEAEANAYIEARIADRVPRAHPDQAA